MYAQDVADDELPVAGSRDIDDGLRVLHRLGERLLAEHVAARVERRTGVRGVRLRVRVDADGVRLRRRESRVVIAEFRHAAQLRAQAAA